MIFYQNPPNYWLSDHDVGSSETVDTGGIQQYDIAINTVTGTEFICLDPTVGALKWIQFNTFYASGDVTLSLGVHTVSLPAITAGDKINLSYNTPSGTPGAVYVSSVTAGTGFTITSTSLLDSSVISYRVFN